MNDRPYDLVRIALSLHLDLEVDEIEDKHELERDLGMDPLDLVLVVLRLEEIEESEFPIADLEGIQSVGELAAMVRWWMRPPARSSGTRLIADEVKQALEANATYR